MFSSDIFLKVLKMDRALRLIVRQRHLNEESLESMLNELSIGFGIDSYSARQNLKGDGLGVLALDRSEDRLIAIGGVIEKYGYEWCISDLDYPSIRPFNAKGFRLTRESIIFRDSMGRETELPSGARVMVIAASFSNSIINKIVHKAVNFQGKDIRVSTQEKFSAILKSGQAVLDIYVLPHKFREGIADHGNVSPIRLTPGGFDPASLGKYAGESSIKNLETALRIVRKYAGKFSLEMDFGLFSLPGIQLETNGTGTEENNQKSLLRYGWLLQKIYRHNETRVAEEEKAVVAHAAAVPVKNVKTEKASSVKPEEKPASHSAQHPEKPIRERVLPPPPPERTRNSFIGSRSLISIVLGAVVLSGAFLVGPVIRFSTEIATLWWQSIGRNGISFFILGLIFFYMTFRYLRLKRWIENTPTSKARSLSMGMVEVKGTVERMYNLIAPISRTPCVYYRVRKYVLSRGRRKDHNAWSISSDTNSGPVPFILRDETGSVIIEPEGAEMRSLHKETFAGGGLAGMGAVAVPQDVKFVEETIPELASVYVLGFASPRKSDTPAVENIKTDKLRQLKRDQEKLMQYDEDRNGRIDDNEWERARQDAEYAALKDALAEKEAADKIEEKVVVHKPLQRGLPFIIAEESEDKLSFWFNVGGVIYFGGAVASSVAGVVLLIKFLAFG